MAAAGLVVGLLAGCGGGGDDGDADPVRGGTLDVAVTGELAFDPATAVDRAQLTVADLVSDSLTEIEPNTGLAAGALAASWEADPNQQVFTFTLVDGASFSDGTPLVAADVVAAWERVVDPATASPYAPLFAPVSGYAEASLGVAPLAGLSAPDEATVVVQLDEPLADFPAVLAHPGLGVVRPDDPGVGSGPFSLSALDDTGVTLVARGRAPAPGDEAPGDESSAEPADGASPQGDEPAPGIATSYHGTEPLVDEVRFMTFETLAEAAGAVVDGDADMALLVGADGDEVSLDGGTVEHRAPFTAVSYYAMNIDRPALADRRFREAIVLAVDAADVLDAAYGDFADLAAGIVPPNLAGGLDECGEFCGPDVARARELLTEVFGDDTPNTVPIHHDDTEVQAEAAAEIGRQLEEVGIPVDIQALPADEYDAFLVNGDPALFRSGWVSDAAIPRSFLVPAFATDAVENVTRSTPAGFEDAVAAASRTGDPTRRDEQYSVAQESVLGDAVVIPIAQFVTRWLASPAVQDVAITPYGTFSGAAVWMQPDET